MKMFFRYLGMAFEDFIVHILLAFKYFFKNLFRAFWHPKKNKPTQNESWDGNKPSRPKFVSSKSDGEPPPYKKRRHRGGKKHRGGRKHRPHHSGDAPKT